MGTFVVTFKAPSYLNVVVEADSKDEAADKAQASEYWSLETDFGSSEVYRIEQY